jgi:hypothetical protein
MAGGWGNNLRIEREVTDFPDPLSPTSASISPRFTVSEIFFTAGTGFFSASKSIERLSIDKSGDRMDVV